MNELSQDMSPGMDMNITLEREDLADAVRSMALLANLSISMWSGERTDHQVGAKIKHDAGAVGNTGRYIKHLLAGCDTQLKDLRGAYTAARTVHYKLTLPWVSDPQADRQAGPRLLPNALFLNYIGEMGRLQTAATDKLTTFIHDYPALAVQAQANLAGLGKPEDYPAPEQVKASFRLHFDFEPIPPASAFANLPEQALKALSKGLARRQQSAAGAAQAAMWERVREQVGHLASRLSDPEAAFKENTIDNVRELITLLPGFNCTLDPRVDEVVEDIKRMLMGTSAQEIRKFADTRKDVAAQARALGDKLTQWQV
jgi:hypothetical protein